MKAFRVAALCAALVLGVAAGAARAQGSEPPKEVPAGWGPMSINLEDVPYPHPVSYFQTTLEGQDVRMAYMDVSPVGTPNGKSVILLHGMNFFAEAWTDTIEILSKEGYRVIAIDQIGYGRWSKPIMPTTSRGPRPCLSAARRVSEGRPRHRQVVARVVSGGAV